MPGVLRATKSKQARRVLRIRDYKHFDIVTFYNQSTMHMLHTLFKCKYIQAHKKRGSYGLMYRQRTETIAFEEEKIPFSTIQRLIRPRRADLQTASSSVICGMCCCGCGALVGTASFRQVARHGGVVGICRAGKPPTHGQA